MIGSAWSLKIKSETGAATIMEAAFIFPLIFIVLGALIMLSIYSLQKATLVTIAQRAAVYISRVKANPNELQYRQTNNFGPDFTPSLLDAEVINSLKSRSYVENWVSKIPEQDKLMQELDEIVNKHTLISAGMVEKKIKIERLGIRQYIVIELKLQAEVPLFVTILGLNSFWDDALTVRATVNDQVSFINDIDFVIDYSLYFRDHFQLDEKISNYIKQVTK